MRLGYTDIVILQIIIQQGSERSDRVRISISVNSV